MISSGLTRFRVNVLRAGSNNPDAYGRRTTTTTNVGTIICDVRESMPTEQAYGDGVAAVGTYELRTRWPNIGRLSITQIDKLLYKGKTLRIAGIRNLDQANRVAVIDAVEVT
jgi:hypothetical protein